MNPNKLGIVIKLLIVHYLSVLCCAQGYHFFYFVLQWPGSVCDTKGSCCYPSKISDFTIGGLRPHNIDNTRPINCNDNDHFNISKVQDLKRRMQKSWPSLSCDKNSARREWSKAWKREGTCTSFTQHDYFKIALDLKDKLNLIKVLNTAGIHADDKLYELEKIHEIVREAFRYEVGVMCSSDASSSSSSSGKHQELSQVYFCINPADKQVMDCPGLPPGNCNSMIKFPSF